MPDSDTLATRFSDAPDPDAGQYQAFSSLAGAGAVLGVLSAAALLSPGFWVLPIAGLVLSAVALGRIARNAPWLSGRKTAMWGLALSLVFGTTACTNTLVFRWCACNEARQMADLWFSFLRDSKPQFAHQLEQEPDDRQPLNELLLDYYRREKRQHRALYEFANQPIIRTLMALGDRAKVRYYATEAAEPNGQAYYVRLVYAITLEDPGKEPTTFFLALHLQRARLTKAPLSDWRILRPEAPYRPEFFGGPDRPTVQKPYEEQLPKKPAAGA